MVIERGSRSDDEEVLIQSRAQNEVLTSNVRRPAAAPPMVMSMKTTGFDMVEKWFGTVGMI